MTPFKAVAAYRQDDGHRVRERTPTGEYYPSRFREDVAKLVVELDKLKPPVEQLQTLRLGELSADDLNECIAILEEGGAVNVTSARAELPISPVVVLTRVDGKIVGLGAIKRQRRDYAASKALASGYDFDQNIHELGYVAVKDGYGNRGFSREIMTGLLASFPKQPLWATTSNGYMKRTLQKAGFVQRGDGWPTEDGSKTLHLWIKP